MHFIKNSRDIGKSHCGETAKEEALDAGKTVIVVSSDGTAKLRRVKHLTIIEPMDWNKPIKFAF